MTAITCSICGSPEWCACAPGTVAEQRIQGNLCLLRPEPEVPLVAWCAGCWPYRKPVAVACPG